MVQIQVQAAWVWHSEAREPNTYVEFRSGTFDAPLGGSVTAKVSGSQEYVLYVNGVPVGRGPSPCTPEWQYVDEWEIGPLLREDGNRIAAVVYHFGEKDIVIEQMQGAGGFLLEASTADGHKLVSTDGAWKCRVSPRWETRNHRISRWGGYNEIYVAEREDGWERPDYDDSGWGNAAIVAEADHLWPRLVAAEIPPLAHARVRPANVVRTESNFGAVHGEGIPDASSGGGAGQAVVIDASVPYSFPGIVYDFGREVVGRPQLTVRAPEGGTVRLAYGESLELQYVDTFVLKRGENVLSPFGRRACRFMQLSFLATPQPVALADVSFDNQHYDFPARGTWVSDDERLNRIWETSVFTTLMNSQDHLEDCPWREKALWIADAVVMGKVIYHVFGDAALLRKCLLQGARIQNEDGSIPGTGPEKNAMLLPDYCAYWLLGVRDHWNYAADRGLIDELWPTLLRLMAWFGDQRDETGLFARANRPGWFCFIDWTVHVDKRDKVTAVNVLYYAALRAMEQLAAETGRGDEAAQYGRQAEELRRLIRERLWLPERQAFADCMAGAELSQHLSLQTNFLAAWSGVMEEAEFREFVHRYYDTGELPAITGAFFHHIVLEVFLRNRMEERAAACIRSYWGAMSDRGATTWWETFDANSPFCVTPSTYAGNVPTYLWEGPLVSQCHGWGASPAYALHHLASGVDVSRLGHGAVRLRTPKAAGMQRLRATIPTREGDIRVEWERSEDSAPPTGTIAVPAGLKVETEDGFPESSILIHIVSNEGERQ